MTKKQKNNDKKILLIYNPNAFICMNVIKKIFETKKDAEDYMNRNLISQRQIEYLGEYNPIKCKIVIG